MGYQLQATNSQMCHRKVNYVKMFKSKLI